MTDLKISEMMDMQQEFWEANKDKWSPMSAEYGRNFILWMIEELGEAIAIIKKKGDKAIMEDDEVRHAFIEEMSDVLMYYIDTLKRYGVAPEEISKAYLDKHKTDMERNYSVEYSRKFVK